MKVIGVLASVFNYIIRAKWKPTHEYQSIVGKCTAPSDSARPCRGYAVHTLTYDCGLNVNTGIPAK